MHRLSVADDFAVTPGGRMRSEGDHSGEEFRETFLEPRFEAARRDGTTLCVDLDGVLGYPTSFLEEAFGGLARRHGSDAVLDTLTFVSEDEPSLIDDVRYYIRNFGEPR